MHQNSLTSGFRTLASPAPAAAGRLRGLDPTHPVRRASPRAAEERWSFEASVGSAEAVFLVLEEEGRSSLWVPMSRRGGGLWATCVSLAPGHRHAKLYAQQGRTLVRCDGADLSILPPATRSAGRAGAVRVDAPRLAWSA